MDQRSFDNIRDHRTASMGAENWSVQLGPSNTFCGSRPTRAEVCRTPLESLMDSPESLLVVGRGKKE